MRRIVVFVVAILTTFGGWAQTKMTVDVPRVVKVGTPFRLVFSVNAVASDFTPPPLDGFSILAGPTSSTSQQWSVINGQQTSSVTYSFTYVVEAKQEGVIAIGSGSVVVDSKTIKNDPVTIEAIKGEPQPQGNEQNTGTAGVSDQDLYLRLELNKTNVVKGEPITATLKLYSRVALENIRDARFPTFNGFWSQETEIPNEISFVAENVGGVIYQVALLRKYVLLPQQLGAIRIDPAELICLVQVRGGNQRSSLFDMFFDNVQTVRKRVVTPVQTVNVQPLPDGAPASFTGAVGTYSLSMQLERDSINAHDATSLIVRITGQGNINMVEAPKVRFPADFEVYDTRTTDNSRSSGNTITGNRQFEYPMIPRSAGTFTIDPVEFSYWDVSQKRYVTLRSNPATLKVGRGTGNASSTIYESGVSQVAVRTLGEDIRYIRTALPAFVPVGTLFMGSPLFWGLVVAMVFCFFILYFLLLRQRELNKDVVSVRSRKANKQARLRLKGAGELLKQNNYARFYEEINRALWGYAGDKLGVPPADHAKERVCEMMTARKASEVLVKEFSDLIEECEFARYAPAPGTGAMDKIYDRALELISTLEQSIK